MPFIGPISGSNYGNMTPWGTIATGSMVATLGFSGSLTRLSDGKSAFEAGANVTITSASNGAVTIAAAAASVTVGSDGANRLMTSDGDGTFTARSTMTFDGTDLDFTPAGTFSIDGVGACNATTNGALTISGSSGLNLKSDGGTLDIETRVGAIDIDAGSTIDIDGAGGINIGKAADVAWDLDSAAVDWDASGAIAIDGTSTFSVDAVGASNVTTNGALTISGSTALNLASDSGEIDLTTRTGNIDINATAGTVDIDGGGGINIGKAADVAFDIDSAAVDWDASGAIAIDGTSTFSVDAVGASNVTTNGALTVSGSTALNLAADGGEIDITARLGAIDINATAGAITIDAGAGVSIDGAGASNLTTSSGALTLAGQSLDIDATSGAFNIAGTAASTITTSGGALTLDGETGIAIQENGTTIITIDNSRNLLIESDVNSFKTEATFSPASDNGVDLGTASLRWANIYTGDLSLNNDRGNWTIIEEETFLSLRDNNTGKRYKLLMEEITGDGSYGPGNDDVM